MPLDVAIPFEHSYAIARKGAVLLRVGDTRKIWPLASVTKLATAWAVLVASERGYINLDDPAGPAGATVRHLLAHASGVPFDSPQPQFAPEKRRVYSNAGYEILGEVIEAATGTPIGRWIEESVFEPLGMSGAQVPGSPAASGIACVDDLLALGTEMLSPRLITPALAAEARTAQFPQLAGLVPGYGRHTPCPWGLGPEIRGEKAPHWTAFDASPTTCGHFGVSGSFLWVDPENDIVCAFLGAENFGPWHKEHWSHLNTQLLHLALSR